MTSRRARFIVALGSLLLLFSPSWAAAHPGHVEGFDGGLLHPLIGLDHLLAMVAVGILAARVGGRGLWLVPGAFLGAMLLGGLAAAAGLALPGVEIGIITSVVVLGLLIVMGRPMALSRCIAIVALFAFFHGHAHTTEMAASGSLVPFAAGFLLSTAVLHVTGALGATALRRAWRAEAVRFIGAAIAACGVLIIAGLI
jgi:urease accessory protein